MLNLLIPYKTYKIKKYDIKYTKDSATIICYDAEKNKPMRLQIKTVLTIPLKPDEIVKNDTDEQYAIMYTTWSRIPEFLNLLKMEKSVYVHMREMRDEKVILSTRGNLTQELSKE